MSDMGKRAAIVTRDLSTRVDLVEEGLKSITHTLIDMRADMKAERKEISLAFESLKEDLGARARPFPFKEVGAAVMTTVAIIGACISVLNWWYDARSAVMNDHISALSRSADPGELAVLKYRLDQFEASVKFPTASR